MRVVPEDAPRRCAFPQTQSRRVIKKKNEIVLAVIIESPLLSFVQRAEKLLIDFSFTPGFNRVNARLAGSYFNRFNGFATGRSCPRLTARLKPGVNGKRLLC